MVFVFVFTASRPMHMACQPDSVRTYHGFDGHLVAEMRSNIRDRFPLSDAEFLAGMRPWLRINQNGRTPSTYPRQPDVFSKKDDSVP